MIHKTSSDFVNKSISLHLDTTTCHKTMFTFVLSLDTLKHLSYSTRNQGGWKESWYTQIMFVHVRLSLREGIVFVSKGK